MARAFPSGGPQQVNSQDVDAALYSRSSRQRRRMIEAADRRRARKARKQERKAKDGQSD